MIAEKPLGNLRGMLICVKLEDLISGTAQKHKTAGAKRSIGQMSVKCMHLWLRGSIARGVTARSISSTPTLSFFLAQLKMFIHAEKNRKPNYNNYPVPGNLPTFTSFWGMQPCMTGSYRTDHWWGPWSLGTSTCCGGECCDGGGKRCVRV